MSLEREVNAILASALDTIAGAPDGAPVRELAQTALAHATLVVQCRAKPRGRESKPKPPPEPDPVPLEVEQRGPRRLGECEVHRPYDLLPHIRGSWYNRDLNDPQQYERC